MGIMYIDDKARKITNPCCIDFASKYEYGHYFWNEKEERFYFPEDEENDERWLSYCPFCGELIVPTNK